MEIRKYLAEALGSGALVFVGCGAVTAGTYGGALPIGAVPIGLAFGLTLVALIYAIGPISGCHINPAVTLSLWAAGRFETRHVAGYVVAQLVGATAGAAFLLMILNGAGGGYDIVARGLGQNGWGNGYLGAYNWFSAFATEFVASALFLAVILAATSKSAHQSLAGVAIGSLLTVLIITFLNVTGVSLNPARSFGPAIFVGNKAISQLWLFFAAPCLAALVVGAVFREKQEACDVLMN